MRMASILTYLWKLLLCGLAFYAGVILGGAAAPLLGLPVPAIPWVLVIRRRSAGLCLAGQVAFAGTLNGYGTTTEGGRAFPHNACSASYHPSRHARSYAVHEERNDHDGSAKGIWHHAQFLDGRLAWRRCTSPRRPVQAACGGTVPQTSAADDRRTEPDHASTTARWPNRRRDGCDAPGRHQSFCGRRQDRGPG